eukprot:1994434-Pyramimonas_sp.AAC.2
MWAAAAAPGGVWAVASGQKWRWALQDSLSECPPPFRSEFTILRSEFTILRSEFAILRSEFTILGS